MGRDLTPPNICPLSTVGRKVDLLNEHFASQREKHWFTDDLFRSLLRLRGMEANAESGYAEAFHCRKLVLTA
jgi:hypothetical protein